ncbi:Glyoxalase/bleomycin resistance protein/ dioxygenase [Podospora aff. communis PSN243]|uniref:Glyoxalase/bleomycin resistance protein/ dioxygenase n=1 Tax=Podospora aff. communis PSN243 TaxID=3040156 RepID=A0AAV9GIH5_9PEZI|nr:Glyoxalase/bleomycin resistance protein/ dioxygenase [Podospora aff. communis PSN243]
MRLTFLLALLPSLTLACPPLHPRQSEPFPITTPGPPIPPSPSTAGYFLNHAALNVRNLTASITWYRDMLGYQLLFTHRVSPRYTVAYLAHSVLSDDATWPKTVEELTADMMSGRARGLLELLHFEYDGGREKRQDGGGVRSVFRHLGLIVPDMMAAQERMEGLGADMIKRVGEEVDFEGPVGVAFGEEFAERYAEDAELITQALMGVLLVLDLDGNMVEVQALGG